MTDALKTHLEFALASNRWQGPTAWNSYASDSMLGTYVFARSFNISPIMWPVTCDMPQFRSNMRNLHSHLNATPIIERVKAFRKMWHSWLEDALIQSIYGSNQIEGAGCDWENTRMICLEVFEGREVAGLGVGGEDKDKKEVYNCARALKYLIERVVVYGGVWSEELIKSAHGILMGGIGHGEVVPGAYRNYEVMVGYEGRGKGKRCIRANSVGRYMRSMIEELNKDVERIAQGGEDALDPYTLAAKYSHQFVMIHPFGDGNGRVKRMIMNVLLLKYAGQVAVFGGDESGQEKGEYLGVVTRGKKVWDQEDMEVEFGEQTSHLEFARFVFGKCTSKGREDLRDDDDHVYLADIEDEGVPNRRRGAGRSTENEDDGACIVS